MCITIKTQKPPFCKGGLFSDFHDHRKDHGIPFGGLIQVAGKIAFDGGLNSCPVPGALAAAALNGFNGHFPQLFHKLFGFFHINKAAGDDVRAGEDTAVLAAEVHAYHDHTVLGQMLAVTQHHTAHIAYAGAVHKDLSGGNGAGDLAGFAAASFMRGIDFYNIPTTLLSQVDSSIGGKTAIDLEVGKNLVGAFCQPELVVCDTALLSSLDKKVLEDGFGEGAKYALLDKKVYSLIKNKDFLMQDFVYLCIDYKRQIVEEDEFEKGNRKLLNLGHTVAHAIEKLSSYTISHGNAVAIGLDFVLNSAVNNQRITKDEYNQIKSVLKNITNSVEMSLCPFTKEQICECAVFDKKRSGDEISVVNFYGVNQPKIEKIKLNNLLGQFI